MGEADNHVGHTYPADPYAVLGVAEQATDAQIKQAYLDRVRAHPPERNPDAFKRIRRAYDALRTPEKRLDTDMRRIQPWPETSSSSNASGPLTLCVEAQDIIKAARAFSDLARKDVDR